MSSLKSLIEMLKSVPPPVGGESSETEKKSAINSALKEFDKKNKPKGKGMAEWLRPISTAYADVIYWIRSMNMRKAYLAASVACLGVLTVSVMHFNPELLTPPTVNTDLEGKKPVVMTDTGRVANKTESKKKNDGMLTANVRDALTGNVQYAESEESDDLASSVAGTVAPLSPPAPPPPPAPEMAREQAPMLQAELKANAAPQGVAKQAALEHRARISGGYVAKPAADMAMIMPHPMPVPPIDIVQPTLEDRDKFDNKPTNPVKVVSQEPVSTFSTDVDTASYAVMRSSLNNGALPSKDQIRVEELVNYFPYDYQAPTDKNKPFKANVSVYPTPWNADTKIMHIGIKGYDLKQTEKPRSNLVFLIDTSGSMNAQNKLPLLINSFKLLLNRLDANDRVAIVTYAGSAGVVLESTPAKEKDTIIHALENLRAGGSTAGAAGIQRAYQIAEQYKEEGSVNRVILATDGDFNVGMSSTEELKTFIEQKRKSGVFLSVLGFGRGNYNDALMQTLAQNGNGTASYIDTLSEAQKVLVEEAESTLFTIAKDVKIQVEFNPATIAEYRLIGYETRMLNREDFNNDKIDAGDIGAGHTVTALYEITPVGSASQQVDPLRYGDKAEVKKPAPTHSDEYAFVKMRYKLPDENKSTLITTPVGKAAEFKSLSDAPIDSQFATSVAAFGQKLRGGEYLDSFGYDKIINTAAGAKGNDPYGYRAEFIKLVRLAKSADNSN